MAAPSCRGLGPISGGILDLDLLLLNLDPLELVLYLDLLGLIKLDLDLKLNIDLLGLDIDRLLGKLLGGLLGGGGKPHFPVCRRRYQPVCVPRAPTTPGAIVVPGITNEAECLNRCLIDAARASCFSRTPLECLAAYIAPAVGTTPAQCTYYVGPRPTSGPTFDIGNLLNLELTVGGLICLYIVI